MREDGIGSSFADERITVPECPSAVHGGDAQRLAEPLGRPRRLAILVEV
jgi:hypothetical protein